MPCLSENLQSSLGGGGRRACCHGYHKGDVIILTPGPSEPECGLAWPMWVCTHPGWLSLVSLEGCVLAHTPSRRLCGHWGLSGDIALGFFALTTSHTVRQASHSLVTPGLRCGGFPSWADGRDPVRNLEVLCLTSWRVDRGAHQASCTAPETKSAGNSGKQKIGNRKPQFGMTPSILFLHVSLPPL